MAAGAPEGGLELSVSYLFDKDGSPAATRLRERGIEPRHAAVTGLLRTSALRAVRADIARAHPDVVHTHLGYSDFLGGLAARSLRLPVVSTVHVMEWEGGARDALKVKLFAAVQRRCIARTILVSAAARERYLAEGFTTPGRAVVVHNGIVGRPEPGAGAAVRAELGIAPDALVVTMLSVLREGKGHDAAFRAVRSLVDAHPGLRLVVAGDGPAREDIAAAGAALGEHVVMTGHRGDVMALLDATDVLLHPSRVDAFPTALLEAMAARVPVVATAVGGIPEIVDDGVTGALVPAPAAPGTMAEALGGLLADGTRRASLGSAGRARFEQSFTAGAWARRLRAVYDEVV